MPRRILANSWPITLGLFLAFGSTSTAVAQTNAALDRTLANQAELLRRVKPVPKQGQIDITIVDERQLIPEDEAEDITFVLRTLSVDGARTVPQEQLTSVWEDKLNTTISLAELYRIAKEIEAIYRQKGYFSDVIVPNQNFDSGNIVIKLYETGLDEITIESDIPNIDTRLAPYLDRLLDLAPLPVAEVERILLLMSDLGGLTIEGTATRPDAPGKGGTLHLRITRTPMAAQLGLDNFGSREIGRAELTATLDLNDQLGLFETTTIAGVTIPNAPKELRLVQLSQDYPLGTNGLHAGYTVAYVGSKPGGALETLNVNAQTVSGTLFVRYPFIRRISHSLFGTAELNFENGDLRVAGNHVGRDRIRWATAGLSYDQELERGFINIQGTLNIGLSNLGYTTSSDPLSARIGVPDHYRFTQLNALLQHALWDGGALTLQGKLQYAPDPLPPTLRLDLGGSQFGRGFDNGTAQGDSGVAVSLELNQTFSTKLPHITDTSAFTFVDYGYVRNHDVGVDYRTQALGSAGVGVRARINKNIQGQVYVSTPWKEDHDFSETGTRVMFRIAASF
jgi:hemolysin activation/secretion protein